MVNGEPSKNLDKIRLRPSRFSGRRIGDALKGGQRCLNDVAACARVLLIYRAPLPPRIAKLSVYFGAAATRPKT